MFKLPYRGLVPPREAKYSSWTNVGDPCDQSEALDGLPLACVCRKSVGQKQRCQNSTGIKTHFSITVLLPKDLRGVDIAP